MRVGKRKEENYAHDTPGLDSRVLGLNFLQSSWNLCSGLLRVAGGLEEVTKGLSLLIGVGWVPLHVMHIRSLKLENKVKRKLTRRYQQACSQTNQA
jgi:hypothetical protein